MFCKYCGNKIDPETAACPNCGNPIRLEGGNGFWDMAGEPRPTKPMSSPPAVERERVVVKEVTKWSKIPLVIGAALCIVALVLFSAGKASAGKELRAVKADYEAKLSQQEEQFDSVIDELEKQLSKAKDDLAQAIAAIPSVKVLHAPSNEEQPIGYKDRNIFVFSIQGSAKAFIWEKQDANGVWEKLQFNDEGVDEKYGLKLVENLQQGRSVLRAVGLTAESEGTYKCTVISDRGFTSAEVALVILQEKETEKTTLQQESTNSLDEPAPGAEDEQSQDISDEPEENS